MQLKKNGMRDAGVAQDLYNKCPEALQKVMNTFPHNKGKKGKHSDYELVIADINKGKDDAMLEVFAAQSSTNQSPRAAAADLTKTQRDKPSTPPSKIGKPTDKCAVIRETLPGNADAFAKMISESALSHGFEQARLKLRRGTPGRQPQPQQHWLLTHKKGGGGEKDRRHGSFLLESPF